MRQSSGRKLRRQATHPGAKRRVAREAARKQAAFDIAFRLRLLAALDRQGVADIVLEQLKHEERPTDDHPEE